MSDLLILCGGLLGQWALGVAMATLVLGRRIWTPSNRFHHRQLVNRAELIGLGFVFGIAATSYGQFLWSFAGGQLGRTTSFGFAIAGLASGSLVWMFCRPSRIPSEQLETNAPPTEAFVSLAAVIVCLLFASLLLQTLLTPQRLWDERSIFGLKSIVLFEDKSLDSPDLLHKDFVQYHPRYPLLIPLAEQHIYALLGRVDDRWSKLVFPQLYFGFVLTFAGVLQRQLGPSRAWLWALVLATVPVLAFDDYGFLSGQADAPVACFHGLSLLYLWDWLRTRRRDGSASYHSIAAAAVAAAMTLFTKDEGIALFIVDTGMLVVLGGIGYVNNRGDRQNVRTSVTSIILFVAGVAAISSVWFLHRRELPSTTEMSYGHRLTPAVLIAGLSTLTWAVPHLLSRMFLEATVLGLQWWGMFLATVSRFRAAFRCEQLLLLGDVAGALAALLIAGMIAPTPVEEHLGGSSHRFLMQLVPVAVLFMAGQWDEEC